MLAALDYGLVFAVMYMMTVLLISFGACVVLYVLYMTFKTEGTWYGIGVTILLVPATLIMFTALLYGLQLAIPS